MEGVKVPERRLERCLGSNGGRQCSRATSRKVLGVKWRSSMFPHDVSKGARGQMEGVNVPARRLGQCSGSNGERQCSRTASRLVLGVKWGASMFPRDVSTGA